MRKRKKREDPEKEIRRRIREARLTQGLTLEELAWRMGVTYQTVQKYESGKLTMNIDRLVALARALGVPPASLLSRETGPLEFLGTGGKGHHAPLTGRRRPPPKAGKRVLRRIREARVAMGFTQAELARRVGVTYQTVQGHESGRIALYVDRLVAISRVLGVPPTFLLALRESPVPDMATARFLALFRQLDTGARETFRSVLQEFVNLEGMI